MDTDTEIPIEKNKFPIKIIALFAAVIFVVLFIFNYSRTISYIDRHFGPPKIAENVKVTIPEGSTNIQIANLISKQIPNFDSKKFIESASSLQGYLFPDTYFFYKSETPENVILRLRTNFDKKSPTESIEILTMASILEEEATQNDIKIISGILWKRLKKNMPLQVDADKSTYLKVGLPDMPISNPGLTSINAAMNPTESSYYYYIHDKDGTAHFANTYEEHKLNIKKYLK